MELKNLIDGRKLNERFRTSDTVEAVTLDRKDFQYLYEQGEALVFMDQVTYEQIELQKDFVGEDQVRFLHDGMIVKLQLHEERPIGIALPDSVDPRGRRSRSDDEGSDGVGILQARRGVQRYEDHDPGLYGGRRAHPGLHRDRRLHATGGLAA